MRMEGGSFHTWITGKVRYFIYFPAINILFTRTLSFIASLVHVHRMEIDRDVLALLYKKPEPGLVNNTNNLCC